MVIGVAGGTGTVGRHVVRELAGAGHQVRVLTRRAPVETLPGVEHHQVDLATGAGLDAALGGAQVVVDAANRAGTGRQAAPVIVEGTKRLLAAERRAGVVHHVAISIVGIELVPISYYAAKVAQERAVRGGGVPWTIVRATQFHELLEMACSIPARAGLLLVPDVLLQPVDSRHIAQVLAAIAPDEPLNAWEQVAGPRVERFGDLARVWRTRTGRHALAVALRLPRKVGGPLAAGALVPQAAVTGGPTFAAWLDARVSEPATAPTAVTT